MACDAIRHARSRGVEEIEFGGEDGSRADVDYLIELARACYEAGGTRYSFPDTVGFFAPEGVDYYIPKLVAAFPDKPLVIHFHNDFGLGRLQHRARAPPRRHHPHLHRERPRRARGQRAAAHHGDDPEGALRGHHPRLPLRHAVGAAPQGRGVQRHHGRGASEPIIGHNVFSHETGIHTAGMTIHPAIYQVIEPESVGGHLRFLFGKHSGAMAIEAVLRATRTS